MEEKKEVKMYFKGDSGIKEPVDMDGNSIKEGDILTRDYGDNEKYGIAVGDNYPTDPFYKVQINSRGGFFAESIETVDISGLDPDRRFFLHDFRFKYCKIIKSE
jgi:hypothetical protein